MGLFLSSLVSHAASNINLVDQAINIQQLSSGVDFSPNLLENTSSEFKSGERYTTFCGLCVLILQLCHKCAFWLHDHTIYYF